MLFISSSLMLRLCSLDLSDFKGDLLTSAQALYEHFKPKDDIDVPTITRLCLADTKFPNAEQLNIILQVSFT